MGDANAVRYGEVLKVCVRELRRMPAGVGQAERQGRGPGRRGSGAAADARRLCAQEGGWPAWRGAAEGGSEGGG